MAVRSRRRLPSQRPDPVATRIVPAGPDWATTADGDVSGATFVVDDAVYGSGVRLASGRVNDAGTPVLDRGAGMTWLGLLRPTTDQFAAVAQEFGLHPLAAEDAVRAHQRPKVERFGDTLFVVLRPARYDDIAEEVLFGEVHVFAGADFVVTVRHGDAPGLDRVRRRLEAAPALLSLGPDAVLYAVLDAVVDDYEPVISGLEHDVEQIEAAVFAGNVAVSQRIYTLSREVIEFQRAAGPLDGVLQDLATGDAAHAVSPALTDHLRDVRDHLLLVMERLEQARHLLNAALTANATIVQLQRNSEMQTLTRATYQQSVQVKRISAWAAVLFAPTVVGTAFGMNFPHMPGLHQSWGYPFALALLAAVSLSLWWVFRRRGWL